jgi:uncharacterized protein (DUF427 family)
MKAIWKGTVASESNDTVVIESNHYFPASALPAKFTFAEQNQDHVLMEGASELLHALRRWGR